MWSLLERERQIFMILVRNVWSFHIKGEKIILRGEFFEWFCVRFVVNGYELKK